MSERPPFRPSPDSIEQGENRETPPSQARVYALDFTSIFEDGAGFTKETDKPTTKIVWQGKLPAYKDMENSPNFREGGLFLVENRPEALSDAAEALSREYMYRITAASVGSELAKINMDFALPPDIDEKVAQNKQNSSWRGGQPRELTEEERQQFLDMFIAENKANAQKIAEQKKRQEADKKRYSRGTPPPPPQSPPKPRQATLPKPPPPPVNKK